MSDNARLPSGCHCLCPHVHRDAPGVCTGDAETTVTFYGLGYPCDVPVCYACAAAALAARGEKAEA